MDLIISMGRTVQHIRIRTAYASDQPARFWVVESAPFNSLSDLVGFYKVHMTQWRSNVNGLTHNNVTQSHPIAQTQQGPVYLSAPLSRQETSGFILGLRALYMNLPPFADSNNPEIDLIRPSAAYSAPTPQCITETSMMCCSRSLVYLTHSRLRLIYSRVQVYSRMAEICRRQRARLLLQLCFQSGQQH